MDGETEYSDAEWREKLDVLANTDSDGLDDLYAATVDVALALNTAGTVNDDTSWSVDFAQDTDGECWLIDAALAEKSWHPDCEDGGEHRDS